MSKQQLTINAKGKVLGRLASEIALKLQGKDLPSYRPNQVPEREVLVENASQIRLTGKKARDKIYYRHSGYPGGLKSISFQRLFKQSPEKVLKLAVKRMLPDNKLRKQMLKQLKVKP